MAIPAVAWEGEKGNRPQLADDGSWPGPVLAVEAQDGACLERSQPPWREAPATWGDLGSALAELAASRERLFPVRLRAQLLLDSSQIPAAVLAARLRQLRPALEEGSGLQVVVESFAYPRGVPLDLDWCFDARPLRNPYWEPQLRLRSGLDPEVRRFVLAQPLAEIILGSALELVRALRRDPGRARRRALRLALGCTGGFHRSVALAEELTRRLGELEEGPLLWHRDLSEGR